MAQCESMRHQKFSRKKRSLTPVIEPPEVSSLSLWTECYGYEVRIAADI